jgi:hypothetical protein
MKCKVELILLKNFTGDVRAGYIILCYVNMVNENSGSQTPMILFLGLTLLILGVRVFQQKLKLVGGILMVVSLFSIFVSIQGFLFN